MSELRLAPSAVVVWVLCAILLLRPGSSGWVLAGIALLLAVGGCLWWRQLGQALVVLGLGVGAGGLCLWRQARAAAWTPPEQLSGRVSGFPVELGEQRLLVRLKVEGVPGTVALFTSNPDSASLSAGAEVNAQVSWSPSERPGVLGTVATGELTVISPPQGLSAWAEHVRSNFLAATSSSVGPSSQGLVPGMVLGDTSLQSESAQQLYRDTGLSHLSAVSGANVAIVTTAAVLVCRMCGLGLRVQTAIAGVALACFVVLVGTEPSVLRAAVTGTVGLIAVFASSRMEPLHALSLAIIALLVVDSDLAVSFGFALSVAATLGIIVLNPFVFRALVRSLAPHFPLPEVILRVLAVAIAADVLTMPIVALMVGRVSIVSVAANVLAAPAVAPVTIVGLIAALFALLPGGLEYLPLKLVEPCTWWIHHVALWAHSLPLSTIAAHPYAVLVLYAWVLFGVCSGHPLKTGVGVLSAYAVVLKLSAPAPAIPWEELEVVVVDSASQLSEPQAIPPRTQAIVVLDPTGRPSTRPILTREGIPVFFPQRDGPVRLHRDGTQHAEDGRF